MKKNKFHRCFILVSLLLISSSYFLMAQVRLSEKEKSGLLRMREEEKLARDVYNHLYNQWGLRPFQNIARSEQKHMDRIKILLDSYGLEDPVSEDRPGKFKSSEMQKLYNDLTTKGEKSLYDALMVGAGIEDLDIFDLEKLMEETDKSDILLAYTNLRDGSINHINAFNRQLQRRYGENYRAQYISQTYLEKILR